MVNLNAIMGSYVAGASGKSADGCFCFTLEQQPCLTRTFTLIDATHPFVCAMPYWWPVHVSFLTTKRASGARTANALTGIHRLFKK
jgi:hypothetical protein